MSESFNILVVIDLLSDLDTTIDNHLPSVASKTKAMNTRYVLISFTGAALAKTFACVSSRDVCRQMCLNKMCASLGAYIRIEDRNGRPAYKQLHENESEQRVLYYKSGTWLVRGNWASPITSLALYLRTPPNPHLSPPPDGSILELKMKKESPGTQPLALP